MSKPATPLTIQIKRYSAIVENALRYYFPKSGSLPPKLHSAMRYTLFSKAKRLRPIVAILSSEAFGGRLKDILPTACAIELIHTYSLIHDDLPSMDDDDFRRGKPSSHKKFGDAVAILSGDALLTLAFEVIARNTPKKDIVPALVSEVASAAGGSGMVGGQVLDLGSRMSDLGNRVNKVNKVRLLKTAALFIASARTGAISAGASKSELEKITTYGRNIGLAFQIVDDIVDKSCKFRVKSSELRLANANIRSAKVSVKFLGGKGKILSSIADYIIQRAV